MVELDAQTWLNEKFPTRESREKVKDLNISGTSGACAVTKDLPCPPRCVFLNLRLKEKLDLSEFINLEKLFVEYQDELTEIQGLENCRLLSYVQLNSNNPRLKKPFTLFDSWKTEIANLKAQLAEYEREETSSQTSQESSYSNLTTKIAQKKQELANLRDTTRKPTKFLRQEIELLEKLQTLENKVSELAEKEANYRQQLSQKEQTISHKQGQIEQLKNENSTQKKAQEKAEQKVKVLEKQITDLTAEKQAIQERMLQERQAALNDWKQEKTGLTNQITQLKEQKDTFQKSADYLRETLRGTEKSLEEIKRELAETKEQSQTNEQTYQQSLAQKEEVLRQRNEAFRVLQERNVGLQANLTKASEENSQLMQWISKLEEASVEGDAFVSLKGELAKSQQAILSLEEQLSAKQGKSYWWVYLLLAAGALYLVMS